MPSMDDPPVGIAVAADGGWARAPLLLLDRRPQHWRHQRRHRQHQLQQHELLVAERRQLDRSAAAAGFG